MHGALIIHPRSWHGSCTLTSPLHDVERVEAPFGFRWTQVLQLSSVTGGDVSRTTLVALKGSAGGFPILKSVVGCVLAVWNIANLCLQRVSALKKRPRALSPASAILSMFWLTLSLIRRISHPGCTRASAPSRSYLKRYTKAVDKYITDLVLDDSLGCIVTRSLGDSFSA